ncbi:unnamed protein product [Cercopithifilaria johnstoni]|uniref:Uncharacterized protein n=1 Tax=Cercopithifilaria johnstoni TaxID=2874296 RepID=A0A8J2LVJ0_9BILA|nr:unnamed protein product [Cercopithifilaria johnstoni]
MRFALLSLIYLFTVKQAIGKVLNRKVSVPDNDNTLKQILYRSGTLYTNSKLPSSETNWWIPVPGQSLKATMVRTYNREIKKYYATYNFFQTNARSLCSKSIVSLNNLRTCELETPITQQQDLNMNMPPNAKIFGQECNLVFAWTEGDWATVEIEGICDIKSITRNQIKVFRNN